MMCLLGFICGILFYNILMPILADLNSWLTSYINFRIQNYSYNDKSSTMGFDIKEDN